jgi:hypothetical protein
VSDEAIEYGKEALHTIQDILLKIIPENEVDPLQWITKNVWAVYS